MPKLPDEELSIIGKLCAERETEHLRVCDQTHGCEGNSATVFGHPASVRICIRLFGSDIWIYDPRWENR